MASFDTKLKYEADVDTVMRMYASQDYFEKKYAMTALSHQVLDCETSDNQFRIRCQLKLPSSAPIPGFAKKLLGETMDVMQEDRWDTQAKTGELNIEISGTPVKIHCAMALKQGADGAENHMHWTVSSKLPLIGGKLEKLVSEDIQSKTAKDEEVSNRILVTDFS